MSLTVVFATIAIITIIVLLTIAFFPENKQSNCGCSSGQCSSRTVVSSPTVTTSNDDLITGMIIGQAVASMEQSYSEPEQSYSEPEVSGQAVVETFEQTESYAPQAEVNESSDFSSLDTADYSSPDTSSCDSGSCGD